ncbi:MAG: cell division protein ZipA, partial [Pseudomonadales bacterium]|nr:cell division protein ZipA [Pseudomonadales bacterium]
SIPVLMDPVEISEAQEEETIEESLSYSEDNYGDPDSVLFDYSDNNHRDERDSNDFEDTEETEDTEDTENSRPSMYREDNLSSVMPSYPDDEWGDEEDEEEGEIPEGFHEEDFGDSSYADDEWGSSDISDEKGEIDEEVASDEEIIAAFKSRQASSSSVDVVDEEFDDIDGYDFDDEDEKVVTEAGETDKRKEPTIGGSLEDSLDEFSMTAGERIGHHDADEQETHQSELLEDDGPEEETAVAPKEKFRFRSFLSVFSRSEKKELPLREQREEARDEALFEEAENEIQTTNQAFEEDNIAHIEEAASARASGVEISPNAGRSIEQETSHQSEVIVINVMAQAGRVFEGNDLLQVLVTAGLRFGEMNIFHHRLNNKNKGPLIFSVANILNPGTFDLNEMEEFSTIGISLFLALPAQINNLQAFEQMLEVAQQVRGALDGELKDDHRSIMTAQTIEHYRQRIRDFELRQLKAAGSRA